MLQHFEFIVVSYMYKIQISMVDDTNSTSFLLFNHEAMKLLNVKAVNLKDQMIQVNTQQLIICVSNIKQIIV